MDLSKRSIETLRPLRAIHSDLWMCRYIQTLYVDMHVSKPFPSCSGEVTVRYIWHIRHQFIVCASNLRLKPYTYIASADAPPRPQWALML
ncbi:hypothetical protein KC328_g39 [Hortaea werneckii]|nr:hypothetical protein KC328_g39 [Hortaea werneckii]